MTNKQTARNPKQVLMAVTRKKFNVWRLNKELSEKPGKSLSIAPPFLINIFMISRGSDKENDPNYELASHWFIVYPKQGDHFKSGQDIIDEDYNGKNGVLILRSKTITELGADFNSQAFLINPKSFEETADGIVVVPEAVVNLPLFPQKHAESYVINPRTGFPARKLKSYVSGQPDDYQDPRVNPLITVFDRTVYTAIRPIIYNINKPGFVNLGEHFTFDSEYRTIIVPTKDTIPTRRFIEITALMDDKIDLFASLDDSTRNAYLDLPTILNGKI